MYWPRFRLTKTEAKRWTAYSSPDHKQKQVLYRTYAGELQLSTTNREDTENLQISRRARVFALTASGDVNNIEIQIYDSSGEQYTMDFIPVSQLLLGAVPDFRSVPVMAPQFQAFSTNIAEIIGGLVLGADTVAPHIFEPNIVLDPNQTLSIKGRCMHNLHDTDVLPPGISNPAPETATLCFNLHVWEFPIE
jgi:hypothetical protein